MASPVRVHALAAVSLLVLAGCESPRDPEPVEKTLPIAIGIVGLWATVIAVLAFSALRSIARRSDGSLVRHPMVIAVLTVAPVVVACLPVMVFSAREIAFGYTEPRTALWSWSDIVGLTVFFAAVSTFVVVIALSISLLATHSNGAAVVIGQCLLALPTAAVAIAGFASDLSITLVALAFALPWTVAFALTWYRRPAPPGPYRAAA